jgi:hypothetical protein
LVDGVNRTGIWCQESEEDAVAFKIRDLIVTVVPSEFSRPGVGDCESTSGGCDATSGGCGGGTCDGGSGGTVGSCTSECGGRGGLEGCGFSDELLDPLKAIVDPPYLLELRLLLRHAVAKSRVAELDRVEAHLAPKTVEEVEVIEKQLTTALGELREMKASLPSR